ncbi:hypothetical protein BCR37DRAFT_382799 [Protomyces lactucae-debilis]|uniref:Extracellular membrane protein CFEM domain-containing protein n=1 Tax=Protomyces lactucae-debilis TaxID=2754530 RepID=A0A1Y2F2Y4_PROLT|nr:uncharacterized protein BCR37DRAFT_382799 [Protomyces lactucae-debilis]ORY77325.1 hypothetical protein BCR37DRAFT_382799 [Protomyces lactucae-debilis]
MRRDNTKAVLFWFIGAMNTLPVVMSQQYNIGRPDSKIDKDASKNNMNFAGSGCQRWQFKFQKTLHTLVGDITEPPCGKKCTIAILKDFTAALTATNITEGGEKKLDGCVADSGVCAGLSSESFQVGGTCYCIGTLVALRLHGGSQCERNEVHKRFADRLKEDWTTKDNPGLLQSKLHCNQRKASHCSCAKFDKKNKYYGLPHGKECPAEVGNPFPNS